MNYRRGFQRLYAVLTVAWAAVVCFAYQWTAQPRADGGDWFTQKAPPKSAFGAGEFPPGMRPDVSVKPPPGYTLDTPPAQPDEFDQYKVRNAPPKNPATPTTTTRYAKGISIALIPPASGYLILFQIVPWIWRGFKPGAQI
jgi:hypothetical protein